MKNINEEDILRILAKSWNNLISVRRELPFSIQNILSLKYFKVARPLMF
jgi:hypothetical protein